MSSSPSPITSAKNYAQGYQDALADIVAMAHYGGYAAMVDWLKNNVQGQDLCESVLALLESPTYRDAKS